MFPSLILKKLRHRTKILPKARGLTLCGYFVSVQFLVMFLNIFFIFYRTAMSWLTGYVQSPEDTRIISSQNMNSTELDWSQDKPLIVQWTPHGSSSVRNCHRKMGGRGNFIKAGFSNLKHHLGKFMKIHIFSFIKAEI